MFVRYTQRIDREHSRTSYEGRGLKNGGKLLFLWMEQYTSLVGSIASDMDATKKWQSFFLLEQELLSEGLEEGCYLQRQYLNIPDRKNITRLSFVGWNDSDVAIGGVDHSLQLSLDDEAGLLTCSDVIFVMHDNG